MTAKTRPAHVSHRDVKSQIRRVAGMQAGAVQQSIFDTTEQVLRTLSHSLGNPLAGLSLTLELLAGTALSPNQLRYVDRCMRVTERLSAFKDVWGRLGSPEGQGPFEAINICPVIDDVLHTLHLGSSFHVEVDVPHEAQQVFAHEGLLGLALTHLLRNAAEAQGQGGALGVCSRRLGESVRVSVWDEGPGLTPAAQEALWITPIPGKAHGGGMGLFWVAAIVETVHHGNLCFSARDPQGAAFHMDLKAPHHYEGAP